MLKITAQAPACKPEMSGIIDARRFRLLLSLNYAPELSTSILADPVLYQRIVGARDPSSAIPRKSPRGKRHMLREAA